MSVQMFVPSATFKSFAGGEFLTPKGQISLGCTLQRIQLYVKANGLETVAGFTLDDELKTVLATTQQQMSWEDLIFHVQHHWSRGKN